MVLGSLGKSLVMNVHGVIQNAKSLIAFLFADAFIAEEKQKWPNMAYGLVSLYTMIFPAIESFFPVAIITSLVCWWQSCSVHQVKLWWHVTPFWDRKLSAVVIILRWFAFREVISAFVCFLLTTREESEEANEWFFTSRVSGRSNIFDNICVCKDVIL